MNAHAHPPIHSNLDVALRLAKAGIYIFLCRSAPGEKGDKRPLGVKSWTAESTTDESRIRAWFRRYPDAIVGIDCGKSNLVVLDPDRHGDVDGVANFDTLLDENGGLPEYPPMTLTPGNGQHYYFVQPEGGRPIGNGEGSLPPGINVRGAGGYVIAQGSMRADGVTGWKPAGSGHPDLVEAYAAGTITVIPDWLLALIGAPKQSDETAPQEPQAASGDAQTEEPLSEFAKAHGPLPAGSADILKRGAIMAEKELAKYVVNLSAMGRDSGRNIALNNAALDMGHMIAAGYIGEQVVRANLTGAMHANGYVTSDGIGAVRKTLDSGISKGKTEPHKGFIDRPREEDREIEALAEAIGRQIGEAKDGVPTPPRKGFERDEESGDIINAATGEIVIEGVPDDIKELEDFIINMITLEGKGFPYKPALVDHLHILYREAFDEFKSLMGGLKARGERIETELVKRFKEIERMEREEAREAKKKKAQQPRRIVTGRHGKLLPGSWGRFELTNTGLWTEISHGSGESRYTEDECIAPPFEVIGRATSPDGKGWATVLRWIDEKGREVTEFFTAKDIHADLRTLGAQLHDGGLVVAASHVKLFQEFLSKAVVYEQVYRVDNTGYHEIEGYRFFVLPKDVIAPDDAPNVMLKGASKARYASAGTLEDWQGSVGRIAADHEMMRFVISAGLAGPLLYPVGIVGAALNLFGESSKGKSKLLCSVASIWGLGRESGGFVRGWRATANALEAEAAATTDTALILDEIGAAESRDLSDAIYNLHNGHGKGRADRNGDLREGKKWRSFVISSGEKRAADKVADDGRHKAMAGQAARMVDISVVKSDELGVFDNTGGFESAGDLAEAIGDAAATNYGTAGPEFVRRLIREDIKPDKIRELVDGFVTKNAPAGSDGQVRRVSKTFGLIAAAGEIAIGLGVLPWEPGSAESAASEVFNRWIAGRGGHGSAENMDTLARWRAAIELHGDSRFSDVSDEPEEDDDAYQYGRDSEYRGYGDNSDEERAHFSGGNNRPVINRLGWKRTNEDGETEWCFSQSGALEVSKGHVLKNDLKALDRAGVLLKDADGRLKRKVTIPGVDQFRCYVIKSKILEDDEG